MSDGLVKPYCLASLDQHVFFLQLAPSSVNVAFWCRRLFNIEPLIRSSVILQIDCGCEVDYLFRSILQSATMRVVQCHKLTFAQASRRPCLGFPYRLVCIIKPRCVNEDNGMSLGGMSDSDSSDDRRT